MINVGSLKEYYLDKIRSIDIKIFRAKQALGNSQVSRLTRISTGLKYYIEDKLSRQTMQAVEESISSLDKDVNEVDRLVNMLEEFPVAYIVSQHDLYSLCNIKESTNLRLYRLLERKYSNRIDAINSIYKTLPMYTTDGGNYSRYNKYSSTHVNFKDEFKDTIDDANKFIINEIFTLMACDMLDLDEAEIEKVAYSVMKEYGTESTDFMTHAISNIKTLIAFIGFDLIKFIQIGIDEKDKWPHVNAKGVLLESIRSKRMSVSSYKKAILINSDTYNEIGLEQYILIEILYRLLEIWEEANKKVA